MPGRSRFAQRFVDVGAELVDRPIHPVKVAGVVGPYRAERFSTVLAEADDHRLTVPPQLAAVVEVVTARDLGQLGGSEHFLQVVRARDMHECMEADVDLVGISPRSRRAGSMRPRGSVAYPEGFEETVYALIEWLQEHL